MKVALVHEFLTQLGGAEKVLGSLHELFPEAPVYTLVYDERKTKRTFEGWDIRPSFLQKLYQAGINYKLFLPFMPKAIEHFDFTGYDLVVSDSSAFSKGIKVPSGTPHLCYCHTPTRYIWENMDEYVASTSFARVLKFAAKFYLKNYLKRWDYRAAQKPKIIIANSETVRTRIKKYYNRDAEVIHPPVDTEFFQPTPPFARGGQERGCYLTASRLEPYKKIELVIQAFNDLGLPLKVAGTGTNAKSLQAMARGNIEFLGYVSNAELRNLYSAAKAFVFPALEDAGIMVMEALSCGTPVIGYARGGTGEYIKDGENGILFGEQTTESITDAVKRFENLSFDSTRLRDSILRYDKEIFKSKIREVITPQYENRH